MSRFTESILEDAALVWLEALGYAVLHGPAIAAGEPIKKWKKWCRSEILAASKITGL